MSLTTRGDFWKKRKPGLSCFIAWSFVPQQLYLPKFSIQQPGLRGAVDTSHYPIAGAPNAVSDLHVIDLSGKHTRLNRGAIRHDFVGIHAPVRFFAEEVLHDYCVVINNSIYDSSFFFLFVQLYFVLLIKNRMDFSVEGYSALLLVIIYIVLIPY